MGDPVEEHAMSARSVVCGVDGSANSLGAAEWAAAEALRRGLPLQVVHARALLSHQLPGRRPVRDQQADMLRDIGSSLVRSHPRLEVNTLEIVDTAPSALVAASEVAELLVVGSRGREGFPQLLVGSVGLHTATRAYCPVVLVRPGTAHAPRGPEIVLGLDTRNIAEAAVEFAFTAAETRGARLRVLHAWTSPAEVDRGAGRAVDHAYWEDSETALLAEAIEPWCKRRPDVEVVQQAVAAHPAGALVDAAAQAELVVVGRRCSRSPYLYRLGPVTHAVVHHAGAAVAVVPDNCGAPDGGPWDVSPSEPVAAGNP
jgi:nucleotide-binding universal stress UspA family protein